jgi:hypothetical protein
LAVGRNHLALTSAEGTAIYTMAAEERLTFGGRSTALFGFFLTALSGLILLAPFLLRKLLGLFVWVFRRGKANPDRGRLMPEKLPNPPVQLVEALASGEGVLWAGAGLSMQSGVPSRHTFAAGLVQSAAVEGWIPPAEGEQLTKRIRRCEIETALNALASLASKQQMEIAAYIRSIIPRYIAMSRAHELLARIPFGAGLTTNYDDLLERISTAWSHNVVTLATAGFRHNVPFLTKLYGDLLEPGTIRISQKQLAAAAPNSEMRPAMDRLFMTQTVVFVGCSLEGLLADLNALGISEKREKSHFAITGVTRPDWSAKADELRGRFGVEVLACREDAIATELPRFLQELVLRMEQTQSTGMRGQAIGV